ncbi:lipoprotein-releasing ABC transporter permease subunit [Alteromonas gracilis]|uniref:lipoprotein-releasing ABC transporter permease subunit n=1 Tax=Alteromonas gracilis TaxID=1479524 RepID=UPI0030D5A7A8
MFSSLFPLPAFIAYRYAKSNKATQNSFVSFINRFSVAGIALGLMALIIVVSVMNGLEGQLKQRILGIVPHIEVTTSLSKTQAMDGVIATMAFREAEAVVQSRTDLRGVQLHGVEPSVMMTHTLVANKLEQGKFEYIEPGTFHVIIGRALAVKLDVRVGDRLRVMVAGASVYTPFGRMPSQRLVTVAGIFDMGSQMDDKVVYMHLDDVNRLLRDPRGQGISQRLFLQDAFNYLSVVEQLSNELAVKPETIRTWRERQGPLFDAVKMEKNMMMLMLLLVIAVAAFNIVSALVMVVTEKQGDIAVLLTQGMTPAAIMWIFVLNGLFNGVKGAAIGFVLGVFITLNLNNLLVLIGSPLALSADGRGLPIEMDVVQIVSITGLSLLLCITASIYPARRAMKIQPSQALQNE